MTSKEIREKFLDFFAQKGHNIVPSAPMVVKDDPTLMFTNAGMNQFKEWFLGNSPIKYPRVADTQKCLRVSGKHNDLDEVGHDSYHHTMFEMLGNWSFGDYFKKEAIDWAWELLTKVYGLNPERLYATVFEGDDKDGLELDNESKELWRRYLPEERVLNGNKKDNFWEMGDTGPCGPCSEIHVDLRSEEEIKEMPGHEMVNKGHHLVVEIWNLVFIQYNRKANGSLEALPAKHVDTGMGLERLCMAVNGYKSNYDGDIFRHLIEKIEQLSGHSYSESEDVAVAMRVISDHIRAISFSITDGQLPSNIKAGYVIRRILRRAVRYGYTFLEFRRPFMYALIPTLIEVMGEAFPELISQQTLIEKVIKEEEESFLRTLDKGISLIETIMERHSSTKVISGKDAFVLYDTFGFPLDLSELIAKEQGYTIDIKGFEEELGRQKERARNAQSKEEGDWVTLNSSEHGGKFIGYDSNEADITIIRYRTVKYKNKELYQLVFNVSPFYAESGGQMGDSGYIISESGEKITIMNTVKENNLNIHLADRIPINPNEIFHAVIDMERRENITNNHSATHLLHHALRKILGSHVEQKGSSVTDTSFRFDFSHFEKISHEQLREAENMVNAMIRKNIQREEYREIPVKEAKDMGAMALFGEKYGESVRVIRFNDSIELCGGTHVSATGSIGLFKILSESAIAAGVRRIEATTGRNAEILFENIEDQIKSMREIFNNSPNFVQSVKKVIEENETLRKEMEEIARERVISLKKTLIEESQEINGIRVISLRGLHQPDVVKNLAFQLHKELENTVFIGAFETPDKKAQLLLMYTDDLVRSGLNASVDIKEAAKLIEGGGGGQNFLATAGGKKIEGIHLAATKLFDLITNLN